MKYKILLFAVLAEIAQTHQIEMEIKKEMTAESPPKPTIKGIGFIFNPRS